MAYPLPVRTNIYIDGFNLYYGLLRGTPYKWLDLEVLCRQMLPGHDIQRIRYFTAHISVRPDEIDAANRQQNYLRAIGTLPVGLLNPQARQSRALLRCKPTFVKQLRRGVAAASQLPNELEDKYGPVARPSEWG